MILSEIQSFGTDIGALIALAISAFALFRTNTIKILKQEKEVYAEQNARLKEENERYKDRIVRMEARLETLEKVLQGRDPETQKILVSLAESSRSLSASFATHTEDDEKNFALIYSTNASIAKTMEEMSESMKNISRLIDGIEKKLP